MAKRRKKAPKRPKAIGRGRSLSGAQITPESPKQPGTIELRGPGLLGPVFSRLRSEDEFQRALPAQSTALRRMLDAMMRGLPDAQTPDELLFRNLEIQRRLSAACEDAAETLWPGFRAYFAAQVEREQEVVAALGAVGWGVA